MMVQMLSAVSFVALDGQPPAKGISQLEGAVPRGVRLRALQDGLRLIKGQNATLESAAALLRRVESAAEVGSLSNDEAECLEEALRISDTSAAVQKLLLLGLPLARLQAAADSLGGADSVLEHAVRDAIAASLEGGDDEGLESIVRSLEDGAARSAPAARMAAWQQLQAFALEQQDSPLAAVAVGLLASLLPGNSSSGR